MSQSDKVHDFEPIGSLPVTVLARDACQFIDIIIAKYHLPWYSLCPAVIDEEPFFPCPPTQWGCLALRLRGSDPTSDTEE